MSIKSDHSIVEEAISSYSWGNYILSCRVSGRNFPTDRVRSDNSDYRMLF
jgi:hypothetical protein